MSEYLGIYRGRVVDNNDVLGIGRVTCLVPQVQADQPTSWCDPIYPTVYKPNVGDIVWVQFINGDLTKPIYFSSMAVTAEKIEAGTITFENLSGDAVSEIVTQSLAAAEVTIGDQSNRVGDPFFDQTEPFIISGGNTFLTSSSAGVPAGAPKPTLMLAHYNASPFGEVTNNADSNPHTFKVTPGDVYRAFISGACLASGPTLEVGLLVWDQSMAHSTFVAGSQVVSGITGTTTALTAATPNVWADYTVEVTIPSSIPGATTPPYYAVPALYVSADAQWYLTNWRVLEANAGLLLVDGSIFANGTIVGSEFETDPSASRGIKVIGNTLTAYDPSGVAKVNIDGTSGDVSLTGEFGTGPPGVAGVHISSTEFNGIYGLSTYPTVQFNDGSGMDRLPQIFTDTTGNPNLYAQSGGNSGTYRMGWLKLDNGRARLGVEKSPGDNEVTGARIDLTNGGGTLAADGPFQFTTTDLSTYQAINSGTIAVTGNVSASGNVTATGHVSASTYVTAQNNVTATAGDLLASAGNVNVAGYVRCDGSFQTSATAFQCTNNAGTSYKAINASAFNVSSDRKIKTNIAAPSIDALDTVRNMPVYEYALTGDDTLTPTLGVMAEDLPDILVRNGSLVDSEGGPVDVKKVDLYGLVATLIQAVQDLDAQLDEVLPDRKQNKPSRKSRTLKG